MPLGWGGVMESGFSLDIPSVLHWGNAEGLKKELTYSGEWGKAHWTHSGFTLDSHWTHTGFTLDSHWTQGEVKKENLPP